MGQSLTENAYLLHIGATSSISSEYTKYSWKLGATGWENDTPTKPETI
jgi:hypothetical protein